MHRSTHISALVTDLPSNKITMGSSINFTTQFGKTTAVLCLELPAAARSSESAEERGDTEEGLEGLGLLDSRRAAFSKPCMSGSGYT